jgi:hypothetical protein
MYVYPGNHVDYSFSIFAEDGRYTCLLEQNASHMQRIADLAREGHLPILQLVVPYTGKSRRPPPIDVLKTLVKRLDEGRADKHLTALFTGEVLS